MDKSKTHSCVFFVFGKERIPDTSYLFLLKKAIMSETVHNKAEVWVRIWHGIIGRPDQLSETNRIVNAVFAITIAFLILSTLTNIYARLFEPFVINCVVIALVLALYYFSRFKALYKPGFVIYSLASYIAMATTYIYNAGMNGPALILFYLTFHLLIAISPTRQHFLWVALHAISGFALLTIEFFSPNIIQMQYADEVSRYIDLSFSYIISLFFVYLITIHLRKNYQRQKRLAEEHQRDAVARSKKISLQNDKLKQIAWLQSHKVRGPVATILGLAELINMDDLNDPVNLKALQGIKTASKELDDVIRDVNDITLEVKDTEKND
jgi:two-component system sensor histidine kinase/response regulator